MRTTQAVNAQDTRGIEPPGQADSSDAHPGIWLMADSVVSLD